MPRILISFFCVLLPLLAQQVKVAPYYAATSSGNSFGTGNTTGTSIDWISLGTSRVLFPNAVSVSAFKVWVSDRSNVSTMYFGVCRFSSGTTWNVVSWSPAVTAFLSGEVNTFLLASPISTNKFDVLCGRIEYSTPHAQTLGTIPAQAVSESCYYQRNAAKPSSFDTASMTAIGGDCPVVEAWATHPDIVAIGDSILANWDSFASPGTISWPLTSPDQAINGTSILGYFHASNPSLSYQAMGISSQTTTQIQARFVTDALALKPSYVLIDGGVNDVFISCSTSIGCTGGQVATIVNNMSSMLSAAQAAGVKAYIMMIGPWTGNGSDATNAQMASVDSINSQYITMAATYGATVIDQRCVIGQFRIGGSVGNCWDFQPAYLYTSDGLGVHPNAAGQAVIAGLIQVTLNPLVAAGSVSLGGSAGIF